jgi:tRNA(Leu) C34 or U34 (ribose-2'-O)-methylase TrmL
MTQDEIIEMARQAGMDYLQYLSPEAFEKVEAFAKLVAQHEREACAKIADSAEPYKSADLIRARRQA